MVRVAQRWIAIWITIFVPLILGPVLSAFAAEPDPPTVTFVGRGNPPLTCGSLPEVESLALPANMRLLVINETDVDATLVVDNENVLDIRDGSGALLTLSARGHAITMVPACLHHAAIDPLTVTVTVAAEPTTSAPSDVRLTETAPAEAPPADATPTSELYPAASGATTATPTGPRRPSDPASVGPSTTSPSNVDTELNEVDAILVDLGRSESRLPHLVTAVVVIFVIGVIVALVRGFLRLRRRVAIGRHRRAQLAANNRTRRLSEDDSGPANDLRDRLRELVQAAHRGADPGEVAAVRAELFAQNPPPEEDAEH